MLNVTIEALERLSQKLARKRAANDAALRFRRASGRWELRVDSPRPNDATFSHGGRNVLLLDQAAARAMNALTLTVRDTKSGPRLRLRRTPATA